nr:uncharacterized protein LOC126543920 [Dermacentor andersoni]
MNKRVPMVCSVSNAFGADGVLPADGVCDALFYDSLYRDDRNKLPGPYDGGLERFLDLSRAMRYTGFGVSFDVLMDVRNFDVTLPSFTSGIVELWNRGVSHFGALRVYGTGSGEDDVIKFLYFLQAVEKKIQETMTGSRPYYTVIGVSYRPDASYEKVIQHMKKVFKPFIYVVVIHVPYLDKELPTCLILPPTLLENPAEATSSNQPSVMEAMHHIERMHSHELHLPVTISFTLRARFYRPASVHSTSFYEPFQKCRDYSGDSDVSPASVCKGQYGSNFNYFRDGESAFAYDTQQERTVTYDTELTIRTKVCRAMLAYPNVPFGVATFDINLDVADEACNSLQIEAGNFTRLKVLSSLNDYISRYHWNFDQCMNSI